MQRSKSTAAAFVSAVALIAGAVCRPAPAHAEPQPEPTSSEPASAPAIAWDAPPSCPAREAVSLRVETVLGADLSRFARDWQIHGRVSRGESEPWRLVLQLREPGATSAGAPRERVLHAQRCDDLVEAAAVAIAIAVGDARDAEAANDTPNAASAAPAPALGATDATAPALPADSADTQPARDASLQPQSLELSLETVLDSASVSGWALGAGLGIGAWWGALGIDAHAVWLPPHRAAIAQSESADFSLLAAGTRGCYRLLGTTRSLGLAACMGVELGSFSAQSHGLTAATNTHDAWLAPSVGVDLRSNFLGPLAARSRLELLLPLHRYSYRVDFVQPVHEIPALTLRWSVGFGAEAALRE